MSRAAKQADGGDLVMRLIGLLQRHRRTEPDAVVIENALWRYVDGECELSTAMGVRAGFSWRAAQRLARRDDLIREYYQAFYPNVALPSAAQAIAQDLLMFQRKYWPRLRDISPVRPAASRLDHWHLFMIEGHEMPGSIRQIIRILAKGVIRSVT